MTDETNPETGTHIIYRYDAAGNILNKETKNLQNDDEYLGLQLYAYNRNNEISSAFDGTYLYDENGNLIEDCYNTAYTYDCYNRVATITKSDGTAISYTYSTENVRTSKTACNHTTYYCYDTNGNILMEKTDGTVDRIYVWGSDILGMMMPTSGGYELYGYFQNAHGDVTGLYQGDYCYAEYDYDAYGNVVSCSETGISNPIRYSGYYYDTDTQNYYLMNRYYNPYQGRFLTLDPYWNVSNMLFGKFTGAVQKRVYYPAVVQSGNRFAYCSNNPINFTDSTGLDAALDEYIKNNYNGMTVTLAVSRPVPNSREVAKISSDGTLDNGHSFLRLDDGNGNVKYLGFAPSENSLKKMLFAEDVGGKMVNDAESSWNVAKVYSITEDQYDVLLEYMTNSETNTPDYNIESFNCTTWAVSGLKTAGLNSYVIGVYEHQWTLPSNLSEQLDSYSAKPGWLPSWIAGAVVGFFMDDFYGYTPADAAQDLKSTEGTVLLQYDSTGIKTIQNVHYFSSGK